MERPRRTEGCVSFSGSSPLCICVPPSEAESKPDREGQEDREPGSRHLAKAQQLERAPDQRQGQRASREILRWTRRQHWYGTGMKAGKAFPNTG